MQAQHIPDLGGLYKQTLLPLLILFFSLWLIKKSFISSGVLVRNFLKSERSGVSCPLAKVDLFYFLCIIFRRPRAGFSTSICVLHSLIIGVYKSLGWCEWNTDRSRWDLSAWGWKWIVNARSVGQVHQMGLFKSYTPSCYYLASTQ